MLAVGVLAAAAALVLGLRFSVVTLVLLTLATVINFATSVLGGSGPLVVGLQMLATLASLQISYLVGCLLASYLEEVMLSGTIDGVRPDESAAKTTLVGIRALCAARPTT